MTSRRGRPRACRTRPSSRIAALRAPLTYDVTDALTLKSITAYRKLHTDDYIDIDATQ